MTSLTASLKPDSKPASAKIIRNVIFGLLRVFLVAPVLLLLPPLILSKIGTTGYGVWAVFVSINGMTSLADLGLVGALSKYVAEYYARKDFAGLNRLVNTGFVVFATLAFVVVSLFALLSPFVVRLLFKGAAVSGSELLTLFRSFLAIVGINILLFFCSSIVSGLQRMDVTNMLASFNLVGAALLSGMLLVSGWGLKALIYGNVFTALVTLLVYLLVARKLLPEVHFDPLTFDRREARHIFSFSLRLYMTQAAVAVHNQVEKLLLAFFVGVVPVGWYDLSSDLTLKIRGILGNLIGPIMPAASELHAQGDDFRLNELYFRAHKYLAFFGVPIIVYMAASAPRFVELWLGPKLVFIALPIAVLLVSNYFNLVTGPGFLIFAGRGNLGPGMRSALVGIVSNVVLSFVLIYRFGFPGAVIGTSSSLIVASSYFLYLYHRQTKSPISRLLREGYSRPVLSSLIVLGILFTAFPTKDLSWLGLAIHGTAFLVCYTFMIVFSRFFDQYDWSKIEGVIPFMRYARRIIPVA